MENLEMNRVLTSLRNLCSKREYSVPDIMDKAQKALDGNRKAASEVVSILVKEGYVDNRRYCAAFASDKSSLSGWGKTKIRFQLKLKGLSAEDIDYGLSRIDAEKADAKLEKIIRNRMKFLKDDPQWKMKVIRFAAGRGYDFDEISSTIEKVVSVGEE
ncbi:MAG: regulatory protein RecX [Candidatus Cryptobacteroides sp.]|nr:regulatory protein RecX [Candidatus Cryptobacteroides sp.]